MKSGIWQASSVAFQISRKSNSSFKMSRRNSTQYNILIVCEGKHTEPNYFKGIKEEVIAEKIWTEGVSITIRPKPSLEEAEANKPSEHKKQGKRRQLKTGIVPVPETEIEEEYRAVPICYVREAQKGLEDGTFDEAWVVFDKDYHPRHAEAFQLAKVLIEDKSVKIAFSSIAFEHWVLLHFERNLTAFVKSECKDKHKKSLKCGTGNHDDDCWGRNCAAGFLKACRYIPEYSKSANIDLYGILREFTTIAIEHSSWLRNRVSGEPVYRLNPYTDVDLLVKRLLRIEREFIWLRPGAVWENGNILMKINEPVKNILTISTTNHKNGAFVFNSSGSILYRDGAIRSIQIRSGIIQPGQLAHIPIEITTENQEVQCSEIRLDFDQIYRLVIALS